MCARLTFARFFPVSDTLEQQQSGIIIPNNATDYTCGFLLLPLPSIPGSVCISRDRIGEHTLPHSDDATRRGINTLRNLRRRAEWGEGGGSVGWLSPLWIYPHYGAINIQYTFYKILYLDNICALCRLSCSSIMIITQISLRFSVLHALFQHCWLLLLSHVPCLVISLVCRLRRHIFISLALMRLRKRPIQIFIIKWANGSVNTTPLMLNA